MRASRLDSWLGLSRRRAFCVASRAVGDGGRGDGFIACATIRGIVGILQDDMTGSTSPLSNQVGDARQISYWCNLFQW
jgi:hypothetical protein